MNIKETIRAEIERRRKELEGHNYYLDNSEQALGYGLALDDIRKFLDTLPEQEDDKEQTVNLPKWQKLKNIDSYSNRKIWKDDRVLYVADSEGYLYGCSIRELFDKLPKEE